MAIVGVGRGEAVPVSQSVGRSVSDPRKLRDRFDPLALLSPYMIQT